jgi:thymidylate kinase
VPAGRGPPAGGGVSPGCIEVTGIDGAGKSTVVGHLGRHLGWSTRKVRPFDAAAVERDRQVHAALGTRAADAFRGCLLAGALLHEAARLDRPVVFDRYVESARMWWAVKHVEPLPAAVVDALPPPALVLYVDVPVEVGLARRLDSTERDAAAEREFLTACRSYLRDRAAVAPGWVVVDGTASPAAVARAAETAVGSLLAQDVPGR